MIDQSEKKDGARRPWSEIIKAGAVFKLQNTCMKKNALAMRDENAALVSIPHHTYLWIWSVGRLKAQKPVKLRDVKFARLFVPVADDISIHYLPYDRNPEKRKNKILRTTSFHNIECWLRKSGYWTMEPIEAKPNTKTAHTQFYRTVGLL